MAGEETRELWAKARAQADGRGERFGSAHVLAAMAEGDGAAGRLLDAHSLTAGAIRLRAREFRDEPGATLRQVEAAADRIARSVGARRTDPTHVLAALLRSPDSSACRLLRAACVDVATIEAKVFAHISGSSRYRSVARPAGPPSPEGRGPTPAPRRLSERPSAPAPRAAAVAPVAVLPAPRRAAVPASAARTAPEPATAAPAPMRLPLPSTPRRPARAPDAPPDPRRAPWLAANGRDLVRAAAEGAIDPAVGRDDVVDRILDVLQKRRAASVCLIGPPGVGKTAAAQALAHRLAAAGRKDPRGFAARVRGGPGGGEAPCAEQPPGAADLRLFEIAVDSLWAGQDGKGSPAERVAQAVAEVRGLGVRTALVVRDAAHFVKAASEAGPAVEAAVRDALDSRSLAVVGEATPEAWDRAARLHPATARCFTTVEVPEPDEEAAGLMLGAVAPRYAEHHGVAIGDDAVEAAARIARRYLTGRALPDRAVHLLDLAAARARRDGRAKAGGADVAAVASDLVDVPPERLAATDGERLLAIERDLSARIVGHREVIAKLADVLRRNAAGFRTRRPIGSLLFLGPTGVGKTETARAVAECLFPGRENLLRLDMSEYSEPHAVARLVGAPPGYVGFEAGSLLGETLRRRPYQVVLLDEFEKAHPDVHRLFLQVLEEGRLTDGQGRKIDFSNAVVVMTSNLGSDLFGARRPVGFGRNAPESVADEVLRTARRALPPELWNRIDEALVFMPLGRDEIARIARMLLDASIRSATAGKDVTVEYDETLIDALLEAGGHEPALGARPMRRTIQRLVEAPLARTLLRPDLSRGCRLRLRPEQGGVVVEDVAERPESMPEAAGAS